MKEIIKNNYKILIGIILGLILVLLLTGCKKDNLIPTIQQSTIIEKSDTIKGDTIFVSIDTLCNIKTMNVSSKNKNFWFYINNSIKGNGTTSNTFEVIVGDKIHFTSTASSCYVNILYYNKLKLNGYILYSPKIDLDYVIQ